MAGSTRAVKATDLQIPKKWKERETSPERNKVWTEPPNKHKSDRKVPVVYYLCRNGQLEHPHFMEVPLSSSDGLYLRDVVNRLNLLRGNGMAGLYSWSSKRSYKNGFVWHDLVENDFIYPAHGQEYVLKGSELLDGALISKPVEAISTSFRLPLPENRKSGEDSESPLITRRRNQSWSAIDLEYKVYKAESPSDSAGRAAADASTQTDEKRRRRRAVREIEEEHNEEKINEQYPNESTELNTDEISPPPSDSSPETLESLMKADGRLVLRSGEAIIEMAPCLPPSGRVKASSVLMQLISCGSISFRDCGPGYGKDHPGLSLISHYKGRLPRGGGSNQVQKDVKKDMVENPSFGGRIKIEDKEYFSGSLIETKKDEFPALKRSSSYNADRSSHMEVRGKEREGVRTNCIPRKPKVQFTHKEAKDDTVSGSCGTSFNQNGAR